MAWGHRWHGWGIPLGVALLTVAVWYVGDVAYNDYTHYREQFDAGVLDAAWWQVCLFILTLMVVVPWGHQKFNGPLAGFGSSILRSVQSQDLWDPQRQHQITLAFRGIAILWAMLTLIGLWRVNFDVLGWFAPYLGHKVNPWGRGRLGGSMDAIWAFAGYFQIFLTACAGVVAAISTDRKTRALACLILFLSLPQFVFDRTRNTMLSTVLPGFLAWVFLRLRAGLTGKMVWMLAAFFVVEFWMSFIITSRSNQGVVQTLVGAGAEEEGTDDEVRHLGLNMFEELAYVTKFIGEGTFTVNPGQRYFAEAVNPIPRVLWPGKPLIGIDYALARGQGNVDGAELVTATISTGMIGQGVVNFGRYWGAIAAGILMSFWVILLARQDLMGNYDTGRLLLFGLGIILTFNMGRDITLLVLYPFFFGWAALWAWQRYGHELA